MADAVKPVASWLEDRLQFLLQVPPEVRPSPRWMADHLKMASTRWAAGRGHKRSAARLVELIEQSRSTPLPSEAVDQIRVALDVWLTENLEDTEDDWLPYLQRLENVYGVQLDGDEDLAERFEEHARGELVRWSPSPPNLDDLVEYAKRFELHELTRVLEEKAQEDDEDGEQVEALRPSPSSMPPSRTITDAELGIMFARLAR